jgi:hypothetical protein
MNSRPNAWCPLDLPELDEPEVDVPVAEEDTAITADVDSDDDAELAALLARINGLKDPDTLVEHVPLIDDLGEIIEPETGDDQ